jgi:UDP-N-acetylmuramyl tripeptide synthase
MKGIYITSFKNIYHKYSDNLNSPHKHVLCLNKSSNTCSTFEEDSFFNRLVEKRVFETKIENKSSVKTTIKMSSDAISESEIKLDLDILKGLENLSEELGILTNQISFLTKDDLKLDRVGYMYPPKIFRSYNLSELLELGKVEVCVDNSNNSEINKIFIGGLETDERKVKAGDLFFILPQNKNVDYKVAVSVLTNGASAIICDIHESENISSLFPKTPVLKVENSHKTLCCLAAKFYCQPSRRMMVVGVTGSSGKTVTSWLIRGIFESLGILTGITGSIEYAISDDQIDTNGKFYTPSESDYITYRFSTSPFYFSKYPKNKNFVYKTTPESLRMQQILASFSDRGAKACILECSSIGLEQGRCDNVELDICVHLNINRDHLIHHGTVKNYVEAMLKLFTYLKNPIQQRAIINLDDSFVEQFAWAAENVPVVTYSTKNRDADVHIEKIETSIFETFLMICTPLNNRLKVITKLLGNFNSQNILAAIASGIAIGAPFNKIVNGIEAVEVVPGRCELIEEGQEFSVLIDKADTPEALSFLLDNIRECQPSRIITVVGCCGGLQKGARSSLGDVVHHKSDVVILTNDNPRADPPDEILRDIISGWPDKILLGNSWFLFPWYQDISRLPIWFVDQALWAQSEVKRYIIEDRYLAIRCAIFMASKDDIVVISGKGDKDYQEWFGKNVFDPADENSSANRKQLKTILKGWFDDRVECRDALSKIPQLNALIPGLERSTLPWHWPGLHRRHPLEEWDSDRQKYEK